MNIISTERLRGCTRAPIQRWHEAGHGTTASFFPTAVFTIRTSTPPPPSPAHLPTPTLSVIWPVVAVHITNRCYTPPRAPHPRPRRGVRQEMGIFPMGDVFRRKFCNARGTTRIGTRNRLNPGGLWLCVLLFYGKSDGNEKESPTPPRRVKMFSAEVPFMHSYRSGNEQKWRLRIKKYFVPSRYSHEFIIGK